MLQRLRRAMQLRQLSAGVTGLALGLLLNVASNWLSGAGAALVPVIVAIFVGTLSVSTYLWWRNPSRVGLNIRPVRTLRAEAEKRQHAHHGLIAFVSLYRPGRDSQASKKPEDWQAAAARNDYQALDLPHSNLATTIEAIMSHTSRLEHCWLIGTTATDPGVPGSSIYIPALVEYLRHERGLKCAFHHGPECNLPLDDDALVFTKTLDLVRHVFSTGREGWRGRPSSEGGDRRLYRRDTQYDARHDPGVPRWRSQHRNDWNTLRCSREPGGAAIPNHLQF